MKLNPKFLPEFTKENTNIKGKILLRSAQNTIYTQFKFEPSYEGECTYADTKLKIQDLNVPEDLKKKLCSASVFNYFLTGLENEIQGFKSSASTRKEFTKNLNNFIKEKCSEYIINSPEALL